MSDIAPPADLALPDSPEPDALPVGIEADDSHHHDHHDDGFFHKAGFLTKATSLIGIGTPVVGLVVAIFLTWGWGVTWLHAGLFAGMYLLTAVGVTVGFHRLFTHRSFKAPAWVQGVFAALGSMAVEGPVNKWVAMHRCHHQHSDHEHDPHSPNHHGEGIKGVLYGFFYAHCGWIFRGDPKDLDRYNPDLRASKMMRVMSRLWPAWSAVGLIVPAVIGGLVSMSWTGTFLGFLWGGLVRVFFVHHVTWSINSVCHLWGTRPFKSNDESRNNAIFGFIGLGEGWHNNHHAFPTSARHGLRWWEFDASYLIIRGLEMIGLAYDVKVPDRGRIMAKQSPRRGRRNRR